MRFIPVDTGNTTEAQTDKLLIAVYPRGYGEHELFIPSLTAFAGLSPWIRGTQIKLYTVHYAVRFIPVDTGNTKIYLLQVLPYSVYPRGYGEHISSTGRLPEHNGLSPWIRGTRLDRDIYMSKIRFIPVDTGNTKNNDHVWHDDTVYPRGYGEHARTVATSERSYGLSPWIRGTQHRRY